MNLLTDSKALIRAWLLADAALSAAVDGKVYGAHLSSSDAQTVLRDKPIVVFEFQPGFSSYSREYELPVLDVYAYSKASAERAAQTYDLVYARLQAECIQVTGIGPCGSARERERPTTGRNEDVAAWYVRGKWALTLIAGG